MDDFITTWVARHGAERDKLLPLLHAIQEEAGYVDPSLVPAIAAALNLSRADIHGVISFYHDFRRESPARHVLKLCRAESCQARGGAAIEEAATRLLGVAMGQTRGDGAVSIQPVYCLGLCAIGPNALIDGLPVARVDMGKIEQWAGEVIA